MRKLKIAIYDWGPGQRGVNGFGGGEQRWIENLGYFLHTEGN